jgi:Acyl-CoA carboxylase epsilon subunit
VSDQPGTPGDADLTPHEHVDIRVERGNPTDEELAALVAVLGSAAGGQAEPAPTERNLWGHPVDKLRYAVFSWQRVTLQERTHLRR